MACPVFEEDNTFTDPPAMPTSASTLIGVTTMLQYPFLKWRRLFTAATAQNVGKNMVSISCRAQSTRYMVGKKFDENQLYGNTGGIAVGSSPNMQWFWAIGIMNVTGAALPNITIMPKVTYDVEFFDRFPPTATQV